MSIYAASYQAGELLEGAQFIVNLDGKLSCTPYLREGMSPLIIARDMSVLSKEEYVQAQKLLMSLEKSLQVKINYQKIYEIFSFINAVISNPFDDTLLRFKAKALYGVLLEYPLVVFDEKTVRKLSVISSFFPSAKEIISVVEPIKVELEAKVKKLRQWLSDYQQTVRSHGDRGRVMSKDEEKEQYNEVQFQRNLQRWQAAFAPVDRVLEEVKRLVGLYIPNDCMQMQGQELAKALQDILPKVTDPTITSLLKSRIADIHLAQAQIDQLQHL